MREKHLDFQDFCNVVGFILCLPGSTAPVERIFSVMNSMWTSDVNRAAYAAACGRARPRSAA